MRRDNTVGRRSRRCDAKVSNAELHAVTYPDLVVLAVAVVLVAAWASEEPQSPICLIRIEAKISPLLRLWNFLEQQEAAKVQNPFK